MSARLRELTENLATLRARLAAACAMAGREPGSVALLPVTKFFPATDIALLYELELRDFGESREQEASAKVAELALADVRWHMIGRLQRNKARAAARWAHAVHSVDSPRLAQALATAAQTALDNGERTSPLEVFVQVSLDGDVARGGVLGTELDALADLVAQAGSLRLAGLMAVPPLGLDDSGTQREFARLAGIHAAFVRHFPAAIELSAGMSSDLEHAVAYGSTCVRVGTALMGTRPLMSER